MAFLFAHLEPKSVNAEVEAAKVNLALPPFDALLIGEHGMPSYKFKQEKKCFRRCAPYAVREARMELVKHELKIWLGLSFVNKFNTQIGDFGADFHLLLTHLLHAFVEGLPKRDTDSGRENSSSKNENKVLQENKPLGGNIAFADT